MFRSRLMLAVLAATLTSCSTLQPAASGRLAVIRGEAGQAVTKQASQGPVSAPGAAGAADGKVLEAIANPSGLAPFTRSGSSGGGGVERLSRPAPTGLESLVTNFSLVDNPRLAKSRESLEALDLVLVQAGLVSNNGGGFISNNGAGVVSNNGGAYRVAGVATVAGLTMTWDDVTGEIREFAGDWGKLALSVVSGDGLRELRGVLSEGPQGTTGTASIAITGVWEVRPEVWALLFGEATDDQPAMLGDGAVPTTVAGLKASASLVPKGDPTLAMACGIELDYSDRPGGIENLFQLPSRYTLSLELPGMRFDWAGMPADTDATEVEALAHVGSGAITVDTEHGPDHLEIAFESRVASGATQPEIGLRLQHERSGFVLDPARRAGEGALAGLASADDDAAGMLQVGEVGSAPLQLIKGDGATLEWEIYPAAWRETLPAVDVPEELFPVASPAAQP